MTIQRASLDDVFLSLTGRDAEASQTETSQTESSAAA